MDIGPLTVETHPRQEDVQYLEDRLHEYNDAQHDLEGYELNFACPKTFCL
jgi:hypothetical protein